MHRHAAFPLAAATCGALVLLAPRTLPAQAPRVVDSLFGAMHRPTGPGCVIALDSAGRRRWTTAWGLRDLERGGRNTFETRFEAGSVSKQVTAAAVVLLARDRRLSLDDDVRRWIPELPDLGRVTVRMLLTHQSGWRDWRNLTEMTRWTSEDATWTNDDVLALLTRQRALNFAPGSQYAYSNTNYVLAAILVQRVTGQSLRAFTRTAIFAPLGMHHTTWRDETGAIYPGRALGYSPRDDGSFRVDTPIESVVGPSGLLTTAGDLQKWLRNLDTEQVGGAGFRADMERAGVLTSGRPTAYAMGLELSVLGGEAVVSHAGWTGGYVAYAGRMPRRQLSLVVLCNGSAVNTDDLGPILLARLAHVAPPPSDARPALGDTARTGAVADMAGLFRNDRTRAVVTVRAFERGISVNTWLGFATAGTDRFRSTDASREIVAQRDTTGAVIGMVIRTEDGDTVHYARLASPPASPPDLQAFVGSYRNDDTGATISLTLDAGALVAHRGAALRDRVVPYFRDGFRVPSQSWVLTFQRGGDGSIAAFDLSLPRTRQLVFTRQP